MTPKQRQALELAQYAFRNGKAADRAEAMVAIDAALAQPESNEVAAEREACAQVCLDLAKWHSEAVAAAFESAADAIRARGQQ